MSTIAEVFASFQGYLDNEHDIREVIRENVRAIESTAREILICLQCMHQENGLQQVPEACNAASAKFEVIRQQYAGLASAVPPDQYYRFHDHWRFVTQRLAFLVSLIEYLRHERLASKNEVAAQLGLKTDRKSGFHLDLEDYLVGLLQLASELARFSVNSVTAGDYSRPLHVSKFMADLSAGFRLLNLKNDGLRKRFDVLKYDVKKVEEVVYDLSIRGLKPQGSADDKSADKPSSEKETEATQLEGMMDCVPEGDACGTAATPSTT